MIEFFLRDLYVELERESPPQKNEQGVYVLPLNPKLSVTITPLDPGALLTAPIAPFPQEKREQFAIHMMKANLLGQGTGGAVIGLEADEKFLTLSLAIPYDMNFKIFKEALEDFANYVDFWRDEVKRHIAEANQE